MNTLVEYYKNGWVSDAQMAAYVASGMVTQAEFDQAKGGSIIAG